MTRAVEEIEEDEGEDKTAEFFVDYVSINAVDVENEWIQNVGININNDNFKNIQFKLDTGAQCNIIPIGICKKLKINKVIKTKATLKSYSGDKIKTAGKVKLTCKKGKNTKEVMFYVCEGKCMPILGLRTSCEFNLIKRVEIEDESLAINEICKDNIKEQICKRYKDVFKGYGKIKDYKYNIELKENSKGKVEPCRHVAFKLMSKLKLELRRMQRAGIITKVDQPTDFVSSLVLVAKEDGSIRVCLDPQCLNECIKREPIQLPTLEEI